MRKRHSAKTIQIGTIVTIQLLEKGEEAEEFTIVGSTEADPLKSRISNVSPVGQALLGKKKGEKVSVQAPSGTFEYEIIELHQSFLNREGKSVMDVKNVLLRKVLRNPFFSCKNTWENVVL